MNKDKLNKILIHIFIWFAPSCTAIYIIMHDIMGCGLIFSYLVSCAIPCAVAYPLEHYVMSQRESKRKITARRIT
jgi:hypothetical protein